jgi:hypothetical protein
MTTEIDTAPTVPVKKGIRGIHIAFIVLTTIVLTVVITFWFVRTYIYAKDFTPVELNINEQKVLDEKLKVLGYEPDSTRASGKEQVENETDEQWLKPEPYQEQNEKREVSFNERELNAMIANNRDLAKKLSIDLSDQLVSARLLVPMDPDFPILGGKTLRVSTGLEMSFSNARPRVILKGVSLMGIPIPNAWLGGLKNIDLISEFGDEKGFWSSFAEGVENIEVDEGRVTIKLKP